MSTKIDYSINDASLTGNPNKFVSMDEEGKHGLDQNSFELNHRAKNQKLSYYQKWFLKNIINTSNLPIKEIQFNYNFPILHWTGLKGVIWIISINCNQEI